MKRLSVVFSDLQLIYTWLTLVFVYSFFFWTLLNSICVILLFTYWILKTPKKIDLRSAKTQLVLLFSLLYLISVAGMLYTSNKSAGLSILQLKLPLLIFPVIFGTSNILNEKFIALIKKHFVMACAAACIINLCYYISQYIKTGNANQLSYQDLNILPHSYAYITALCCVTAIIFLTEKSLLSGINKKVSVLMIGLFSLFVVLLSIRLVIALLILIITIQLFRHFKKPAQRIVGILAIFIALILSTIFVPSQKEKWLELLNIGNTNKIVLDEDMSLGKSWGGKSIRFAIWQCTYDVIKTNPLLGVGTGDVQDNLQVAYENRKFYFASRYNSYNAHNQFLQTTTGHGIPGILCLVACFIIPFFLYMKSANFFCYGLFLLLMISICMTESILEINKGVIWFSFWNSIFAFGYYKNENSYGTEEN